MNHWKRRVWVLGWWLVCGYLSAAEEAWTPLFDGKTQAGWASTPFAGAGEVEVRDGTLVLNQGILTGVNWTNDFPTVDYELSLEAQRVLGIDFFCGLTFPVGTNHLTLVVGGWGGSVVGLSNIDGESANSNGTTHLERFESGRWYALKLRVVSTNVSVWLDSKRIIDLDTRDKRLSLREGEIERSKPLGLASWSTTAALRQIRWRSLVPPKVPVRASLPPDTRAALDRLASAMEGSRGGWDRLAELCDTFGARPSGSTALESAVDWILERMSRDDGLENVRGEPVVVPRWERGSESVEMLSPRRERLPMLGLGGSVATPPGGITAPVTVVTNFAELAQRAAEVRGRIVLFDAPFTEYGQTVRFRTQGAIEAAKAGAVASLIRSVGEDPLRTPHTGVMRYEDGVARIPHAALAPEDASRIAREVARGRSVTLRLEMSAAERGVATNRNVVAEIRGREKPDEIVVLGGHIDSWDVGQGAQDDGGGCVAAWEALRWMKKLGLRPRRTVRCVLWTHEEWGGRGAQAYRDAHAGELSRHVVALEADEGTFKPLGFGFTGSDAARAVLAPVHAYLAERLAAGLADSRGSAADTAPLLERGVPVMSLHVDRTRYFRVHHTEADTVDKVDPEALARSSAALAAMVYAIADLPETLPR
jgi:carboxypeptidase Q